ncbi:hypothetical protein N566_27115 [Streptomycetaceae bacterium MP113-05]|nr:hypothetical protein N566_27115 [Streptomycetaceae bacterium MP113-05]
MLGVAAVVTSTGCAEHGAEAGSMLADDHLATVRQAADRLERAGTSRTRTLLRTASGGTRVSIAGEGRFDYEQRRGTITVTPPDEEHGGSGGVPITELVTPGALYMRNRGAGVPDGTWVRVDTTRLADGNLLSNGATDPLRAAELLRGADEVSYEGEERIGGTRVGHYRGSATLGRAARGARASVRPEARTGSRTAEGSARQLRAAAEGIQPDGFAFDAWFDRAGRLRKVRHRFESVSVTSTTTMYDFGVPVTVRMPDPADIFTGRIATPGDPGSGGPGAGAGAGPA